MADRVLELIRSRTSILTHRDVANLLAANPPDVHRGLTTLVREGWLVKNPDSRPVTYMLASEIP